MALLSGRELMELAEIADQLRRSDRDLARRLGRHRVGLAGLDRTHPLLATLLRWFAIVAVAVVGLVLLMAGMTIHAYAMVVAGAGIVALVPFSPLLLRPRRSARPRSRALRVGRRRRGR